MARAAGNMRHLRFGQPEDGAELIETALRFDCFSLAFEGGSRSDSAVRGFLFTGAASMLTTSPPIDICAETRAVEARELLTERLIILLTQPYVPRCHM